MHTEDLACYNGSDRKTVKCVDEGFPDLDVATAFAFVVESIDSGDVCALMVTAQQEEVLRKFEFVAEKKEDRLEGFFASIDVVS